MAVKRVRVEAPEVREILVIDPTKTPEPKCDLKLRRRPQKEPHTRRVRLIGGTSNSTPFWSLWLLFDNKMLRKENESTPFIDLNASLSDMEESTFVMCEWTTEYEHLRPRLELYRHIQEQKMIDEQLYRARRRLSDLESRIEEARRDVAGWQHRHDECEVAIKALQTQ